MRARDLAVWILVCVPASAVLLGLQWVLNKYLESGWMKLWPVGCYVLIVRSVGPWTGGPHLCQRGLPHNLGSVQDRFLKIQCDLCWASPWDVSRLFWCVSGAFFLSPELHLPFTLFGTVKSCSQASSLGQQGWGTHPQSHEWNQRQKGLFF